MFYVHYLLIDTNDVLRRPLWYRVLTTLLKILHLLELFGANLWTFSAILNITPIVGSWGHFLDSLHFFLIVLGIAHLGIIFAKVRILSYRRYAEVRLFQARVLLLHLCKVSLWHRSSVHDLLSGTSTDARQSRKILRQKCIPLPFTIIKMGEISILVLGVHIVVACSRDTSNSC